MRNQPTNDQIARAVMKAMDPRLRLQESRHLHDLYEIQDLSRTLLKRAQTGTLDLNACSSLVVTLFRAGMYTRELMDYENAIEGEPNGYSKTTV